MDQNQEYIWYASYGSNLQEERFHYYIIGGSPVGSKKVYEGCKDRTLPINNQEIIINSELYFAKKSKVWNNGGVCFIKINFDKNTTTLGRMYLITKDQFIDVVKQETGGTEELKIDFEKVKLNGSLIIKEKSWYGNIIFLGISSDFPIFTFTNEANLEVFNKPDDSYLKTIIKGIKQTYNLSSNEIVSYLSNKKGIIGNFEDNQLLEIVEDAINNL
jgi:hypothetical protein